MFKKINVKHIFNKLMLKNEILAQRGMLAEIMEKVDWNEDLLTTEERLKVNELTALISHSEKVLKSN